VRSSGFGEGTSGLRHDCGVIARALMLLVALAAIAVLGVWYANAHELKHAAAVSLHTTSPAALAAAERGFDGARRLSPDTSPDLGRAFLLIRAHQFSRAAPLLSRLAAKEPRNLLIWQYLALADPARAAEAKARMERLAPPVR
jgi:predicted Zn-dependent protease